MEGELAAQFKPGRVGESRRRGGREWEEKQKTEQ